MIYRSIDIRWLGHSSFLIKNASGKTIYIDPFKLSDDSEEHTNEEADFIFITHSHYDHCSIEDIRKIAKNGTIIVAPADVSSKFAHIDAKVELKIADSETQMDFEESGVKFWCLPAYNLNKPFHEREEDWVGYILDLSGVLIYHAGDTDNIPEMKKLSTANIDIALLPIGGTFTMNAGEAAKAASVIKPKLAVPMHYGKIERTGDKNEAQVFAKLCTAEGIDVKVLEIEK
jgi:L-ascorbate metabolism protein UlaG (beta-lactamase superfamily)